MATSKTLTPTNVTIQIPEFTDQPDQRVNSNCIDKEADAINSLNTAIGTLSSLTTTEKSNLVGAVNEVNTQITTLASKMQILKTGSQSGKLTFTAGWSGALFSADSLTIGDSYSGGVRKKGILGNDIFTVNGLQVTFSNTFKNVVVFTLEGSEPVYSAT